MQRSKVGSTKSSVMRMANNDHPDFDTSKLRWCEHHNVHEIQPFGQHMYYLCEDCGSTFPCIGDTDEWAPTLIGTRVEDNA